jgi:hypothetical protein
MVRDDHRTSEGSDDLEEFFAIDIMIGVQPASGTATVHNIRRVNERHGTRMFRKLFEHL